MLDEAFYQSLASCGIVFAICLIKGILLDEHFKTTKIIFWR